MCQAGWHHLPEIATALIRSQLALTNCLGDLVSFYTKNQVDTPGTLLSAIYLQEPSLLSIQMDSSYFPELPVLLNSTMWKEKMNWLLWEAENQTMLTI